MPDLANTSAAPGALELVRQFVNTLDIEADVDRLRSQDSWNEWASAHGVEGVASSAELHRAMALREAMRDALLANHDRAPLPSTTADALTDAARWCGAAVEFSSQGVDLVTDAAGVRGLVGRVLAATAEALADGSWSRLKACANDECRWAFYDHSRSRTGRWCSMGVCGNRAKQTRWREKQG